MPHGHWLLLIDDDPDIRDCMQALLESVGYRVDCASDGWAGLELLGRDPLPCAILLDLMMPRMDGFEFRAVQLDAPRLARIPVAVLTAFSDAPGIPSMRPQAVIRKPADVDEVMRFVAEHCQPRR